MEFLRRCWAEIDLSAVEYNVTEYKKLLSAGTEMMYVVKAACYGHDDSLIVPFLQEKLNPKSKTKPEKEFNGTLFRLGDKVMQVRNDYNLIWEIRGRYGIPTEKGEGVFNGDIGLIREINTFTQTLTVQFEDRYVEYAFKDCDHLELAYAITIHKSQGSEYPAVIIPMYMGPQMLMNRNLLYTAVTRAKRCVCLVGNPQVFETMLHNESEAKRYSSLADRMREIANGVSGISMPEDFAANADDAEFSLPPEWEDTE